MSYVIDALTRLEKALGLEVSQVPEDVYEVIEVRKFTGREFLTFLKEEWEKSKELSVDERAICKQYLGELVALAKMTFKVKGASNQISLPTVKDFSPTAMRAMRVFQNSMAPGSSRASGSASYRKSEGAEGAGDGDLVLTRLTLDDLMGAFDRLLTKRLEVPNVEDLDKSKSGGPAEAAPAAEPFAEPAKVEKGETAPVEGAEPAAEVQEPQAEPQEKAYEPNVTDVVIEPDAAEDKDAWDGL